MEMELLLKGTKYKLSSTTFNPCTYINDISTFVDNHSGLIFKDNAGNIIRTNIHDVYKINPTYRTISGYILVKQESSNLDRHDAVDKIFDTNCDGNFYLDYTEAQRKKVDGEKIVSTHISVTMRDA